MMRESHWQASSKFLYQPTYSPTLNAGKGGYYAFPTQSDATPGSVPGNNIKKRKTPNQANYFTGGFSVTQTITPSASQNYLTDVGAFTQSASYYGTFDQAGNVYEWNDDPGPASQRSLRGGYWVSNVADTSYLDAYYLPPDYESSGSGFRLASRQQTSSNSNSENSTLDSLIGQSSTPNNRNQSNLDALTNFTRSNPLSSTRLADPSSRFPTRMFTADAFQSAPLVAGRIETGYANFGNQDIHRLFASKRPMIPSQMGTAWHR